MPLNNKQTKVAWSFFNAPGPHSLIEFKRVTKYSKSPFVLHGGKCSEFEFGSCVALHW